MIDDHPEPGSDPLAGRDPHPREQIDLWPLHDARQELLEEIVSQPGTGNTAGRTKVLLSVVGIAAALALVVGGAWAVTGGDSGEDGDGRSDDIVAATSDDLVTETTTETATEPPTPERPRKDLPAEVRVEGVTIGTVRTLAKCVGRERLARGEELDTALRLLPGKLERARRGQEFYVVVNGKKGCRLVVRPLRERKGDG